MVETTPIDVNRMAGIAQSDPGPESHEPVRRVRVMLVDDHHLVIEGLRAVLATDDRLEVIGEARSGRAAVAIIPDLQPDIVLMDIRMPDMDGIAATRQVSEDERDHADNV